MADNGQIDNLYVNFEVKDNGADDKISKFDEALEKLIATLERIDNKLTGFKDNFKGIESVLSNINVPQATKLEETANDVENATEKIKKSVEDLKVVPESNQGSNAFDGIGESAEKAAVNIDYLLSDSAKLDYLTKELGKARAELNELAQGGAGYENKNVQSLINQINKLNKEIDKIDLTHLDKDVAQGFDNASSKVDKFDKSVKKANNSSNNYNKGLRGLLKTAKQFLIFGTFFTIQRQISEAFKVGTQNAYQYSKAIGGEFAKSMDKLATSTQYFRNSIGAWSSSLINAFAPVIESLIDKLAVAGNAIARFFAALTGQKSVLQATKSFKEYAEATDKATKSNKKALASFDEINNLSSNQSGNNTTAGSQDYGSMFQTVELDSANDKWTKFGETIKKVTDFLGPLGTAIVAVGIALGTFLIIRKINKLFDKSIENTQTISTGFSNFFTSLGKGAEAIAILGGLAIVINSVTKLIDAFAESGLTLGGVAGLLGISLGIIVGAFTAISVVLKLLQPSWRSIAGAVVILGGLAIVIQSVANLLNALGNIGISTGKMFAQLATVFAFVVAVIGTLIVAATILATNPLVMLGVVAVATALWLVLDGLGKSIPPIINSFTDLAKNVAPYVIQAMEIIRDTIADIPKFILQLGFAIENFVDKSIRVITKLINFLISGIEYTINTLVIDSINGLLKGINKIPGVDFELFADVKIRRFNPKLFAKGGYPASGEMFIARENGIPEMVGSIGGRTAVANNDQIVEAVSIGVYNAVVDAMSRSGGNKQPTIIEISGREVFRAVQDESSAYRRRTGQPAF